MIIGTRKLDKDNKNNAMRGQNFYINIIRIMRWEFRILRSVYLFNDVFHFPCKRRLMSLHKGEVQVLLHQACLVMREKYNPVFAQDHLLGEIIILDGTPAQHVSPTKTIWFHLSTLPDTIKTSGFNKLMLLSPHLIWWISWVVQLDIYFYWRVRGCVLPFMH